jgi:hypothetical protein
MKSRTEAGKHTPRFIVQFKTVLNTYRSSNPGLTKAFETHEDAQAAIDALGQLEDELNGKVDLAPTYTTPWPELNRLIGFEDGDVNGSPGVNYKIRRK